MKALITGAGSGVGRDMAIYLASLGYEIYAVSRKMEGLEKLSADIGTTCHIYQCDLSDSNEVKQLLECLKDFVPDVLINNAGFGVYGLFGDTDLESELSMIGVNITALHVLTKFFLPRMEQNGGGHIMNVASTAGFMMGPFLSSYYASKSYVLRLSQAIDAELRAAGSPVGVSVLCPGPVKTGFDSAAGVSNSRDGMSSEYVARYGVDQMLKGKSMIIPGFSNRMLVFFAKLIPSSVLSMINYNIQKRKGIKDEKTDKSSCDR